MAQFVVKMTKNKNFLSPKATIYGKNDQKCFCLQWLSPIWSHFMIILTKIFLNVLIQMYIPKINSQKCLIGAQMWIYFYQNDF